MKSVYAALGDSTGVGVGAHPGEGYVHRLHQRLAKDGLLFELKNFSVSGARSRDVVRGQLSDALDSAPRLVTVGIGLNDVWKGTRLEVYTSALESIAERLQRASAPVVMSNLPDVGFAPAASAFPRTWFTATLRHFNLTIARICDQFGFFHVDLFQQSKDALAKRPEFFSADGFHPSAVGYAHWADMMWPTVKSALQQ